ncbi:MAG: hypothetical protein EZS28_026721 [Streblomastix strix]|uniref:Uncharacterized protein n=1 Tax=Streblomastix strix TaxID=222440 RepID=A0A5J4V5V0_9EUKA|nr:MAG: hypothetical protein EZS28_026721 [Streblomastix strix]
MVVYKNISIGFVAPFKSPFQLYGTKTASRFACVSPAIIRIQQKDTSIHIAADYQQINAKLVTAAVMAL